MKNRHNIFYYLSLSIAASCLYLNMTICIADTNTTQDSAQQTEEIRRPDFILQDLDGNLRDVSEWDGKVLVIVFGATWVAPIHAVMDMLTQLQEKYNDHGVQFIYIAINDTEGMMSDFFKDFNLNFPMLMLDENKWQEIAALYDVLGVPHAVFVDRQGFIRHRKIGSFSTTEEIEAYIRELI